MSRTRRRWIIGTVAAAGLLACVIVWLVQAHRAGKPYARGPVAVVPGKLYRCNDPSEFSENQIARLGIKTVVNTRVPGDRPDLMAEGVRRAQAAGAKFVNIPIGEVLPDDRQIEQFLRIVRDGPHPVLIHCEFGRNRTGLLVAAYRIVEEDWPAGKALDEMITFGFNPENKFASDHKGLLNRLVAHRNQWLDRLGTATQTTSQPATGGAASLDSGLLWLLQPLTAVDAQYKIERGKKILVFVDDPKNVVPYERLKKRLVASLNKELTGNNVAASTVPHERLTNLMLSTPNFNDLSVSEVGQKLGADIIIYVKLENFSLKDEPATTVWNARLATSVKVVDSRGKRLWPTGQNTFDIDPVELPSEDKPDPNFAETLTNRLADKMADKIAKLFYNYNKPVEE
ncbi:MAG: tyrosine-protein phosphatase [Planctomycetes bacterium]|nr:tyrosine-protein phosphatase [Planctomycetota bacterium]